MTSVIDSLIHKGYAQRSHSDADRRIVMVSLTEKGNSIAESCRKEIEENHTKRFSMLSEDDQNSFGESLKTLNRIIQKMEHF